MWARPRTPQMAPDTAPPAASDPGKATIMGRATRAALPWGMASSPCSAEGLRQQDPCTAELSGPPRDLQSRQFDPMMLVASPRRIGWPREPFDSPLAPRVAFDV